MKISTWNWSTHPDNKTRGVAIGPFFGVMYYISAPIGSWHVTLRVKRIAVRASP